jgi:ABC-type antimicrobial peptide transport system permease subunit
MFKNYMKSAFRNHVKNKWNSLINIFSLAIGIACCILIFVYVSHEFSFDQFHKNVNDIYHIYYRITTAENEIHSLSLHPHSLVTELQNNYPAIKNATAYQRTRALTEYNHKRFIEQFAKVDSAFLTMFSFPLLAGDPNKALLSHDKVVISEKMANKFFGELNNNYSQVLGKVITIHGWRNGKDYIISGILKTVPKTSSLQFDLLMLKEGNDFYPRSDNAFGELSVYIQLNKGYNPEDVENSLHPLVETIYGKLIKELREKGVLKDNDDCFILKMQSLKEVYFNTEIGTRYEDQSNKTYSYILIGIGLLILTLACINFINLSIGQSLTRTLEIGIRKVLGAGRKQIVIQYSTEKIVLIFLSLISGYAIADFLLPMFNQLSQKELTIAIFNNLGILIFLFATLLITSFFAAGIPSLVLSRFNPTGVFKALSKFGGKSRINSVLVIVQFFLSIVLLSSAFIMSRQVSYMQNKELGFNKDQIVVIPISTEYNDTYKNNILSYPEIISAAGCDRNFSNGNSSRLYHTLSGKPIEVNIIRVEEEYVNTLGINLIEGRNFSESFPGDKLNSVIVNETLIKEFDLQTPVGTVLNGHMFGEEMPTIVGVVKDYHIFSMRREVPPLILHMTPEINGSWSLLVKIKPDNIKNTIDLLSKQWKQTIPNREFRYTFLNDDLNMKYHNEERWQKITGISTLFAFIISSMGLLGLVIIIINVRTKEIGIRKVLGASIIRIVAILTKDIAIWVIIANLLAWPVAWYAMTRWLENFAYKIEITWWFYLLAGVVALIIALISVSLQTLKAALANPVESLRYE